MIVSYDKSPGIGVDRKMQSLAESVNMALNELKSEHYTREEIDSIVKKLEEMINNI